MSKLKTNVPPVAQASDASEVVGEADARGRITSVSYTPEALMTGDNTNSRTLTLVNKGQDGSGSTNIATLALPTGTNAAAFDEKAFTLNATATNRDVVPGDILAFVSTHTGSGIADPGGTVQVEIGAVVTEGAANTSFVSEANSTTTGWFGKRPGPHPDESYALTTGPDSPSGANGPE